VNQNSQNSSKPPSSDPPAVKRHAPPKKGQRKRRIRPGLGFFSYPTAWRTIRGYEAMHMIRKGQVREADKGNIKAQNEFTAGLFGLAI
jgi:hypothetical protein